MQIVIELPDKALARIRSRHGHCGNVKCGNGIWTDDLLTVSTAIYFGKVLPKGHGRLIDADSLLKHIDSMPSELNEYAWRMIRRIRLTEYIQDSTQTIVEADKEGAGE